MSKTKFSLSKTGCNWVAVPTGSISKNQSVSRQKMENAMSTSKDASFVMSNSKICHNITMDIMYDDFDDLMKFLEMLL